MARVDSENGWRPPRAGADILEWVTIPGAEHVHLEFMKGPPLVVLRAFAADFHANVEDLRDDDSAAFTPTNKVATSNHLNGTAMDLNWNGPSEAPVFRYGITGERAYPGDKLTRLRDLLLFYEDVVYCGGFWSIRDWMHFQMGYNTWGNPKTDDFIRRKIRPDGFSTYKRGESPVEPVEEGNQMANADDVARQLDDGGDQITLYEGATPPQGQPGGPIRSGSLRTWVRVLAWDLLRVQDGVDTNRNGDGKSDRIGLRDSIRRLVFETTLWTKRPDVAELITSRDKPETTHGHARDAAGYGDVNLRILGRIAAKLDIDVSDLL